MLSEFHSSQPFRVAPPNVCGTWQTQYSSLHQNILAGSAPQRYLFHTCDQGLGDCFAGLVTALYLAVLTNRALFTGKNEYRYAYNNSLSAHFRNSFRSPPGGIDWSVPDLLFNRSFADGEHLGFQGHLMHNYTHDDIQDAYEKLAGETKAVYLFSNTGLLHKMYHIPVLHRKLGKLGVIFEKAFGCALDFLFIPRTEHLYHYKKEIEVLAANRERTIIGVHARYGDESFASPTESADVKEYVKNAFAGVISCVQDLKSYLKERGMPRPIIYFLSDNRMARLAFQEIFREDIVVTNTRYRAMHTGPWQVGGIDEEGLQTAAIDYWLFGGSDYFVVSTSSGYGRTAAARSFSWQNAPTFLVEKQYEQQKCRGGDEVPFLRLAIQPPGI